MPAATPPSKSSRSSSAHRARHLWQGRRHPLALITCSRAAIAHRRLPGVARPLLAKRSAKSFHCSFQRIQFTSDLLPAMFSASASTTESRDFEFRSGPIFANVVSLTKSSHHPAHAICASRTMNEARSPSTARAPAAAALSRDRHAKSRRASRHLSPAGIAARPFFDAHQNGLSLARNGTEILRKPLAIILSIARFDCGCQRCAGHAERRCHIKVRLQPARLCSRDRHLTARASSSRLASARGTLMLQRAAQARAYLDGATIASRRLQTAPFLFLSPRCRSSRHASLRKNRNQIPFFRYR